MEGYSLFNTMNLYKNILNDDIFIDKYGKEYNSKNIEVDEQIMAEKYINDNDVVLELGCRYGTVSCVLAKKCKKLVAVDPDKEAVETCKKNMKSKGLNLECLWCTISKTPQKLNNISKDGYGDFTEEDLQSDIPHYTIKDIENMFSVKFNTIVADCEGCLENIVKENDMSNINKIIYETDKPDSCDYEYISNELTKNGLIVIESVDRENNLKNIYWKKT